MFNFLVDNKIWTYKLNEEGNYAFCIINCQPQERVRVIEMEASEREILNEHADCFARFTVFAAQGLLPIMFDDWDDIDTNLFTDDLDFFLQGFVFGMAFTSNIYSADDHKQQLVSRFLTSARKEFQDVTVDYPAFPIQSVLKRLDDIGNEFNQVHGQN